MSTDSWEQPSGRPCRHLRNKEMFYDTGAPQKRPGSGIFWCTHTSHCLGPDGKPASDEDCGPDRRCYEE